MELKLYAGTEEGFFGLKKVADHWEVENKSLEDWEVSQLAVTPSRPGRAVAGTRGDGVWISEDGGKKWKKPCYGKPGPGKVRCVTIDPVDPDTLYSGCEPIDVFVSKDAGKNWTRLDSIREVPWVTEVDYPVATVEPHVRDIVIDPKKPETLYIALQVGFILKSADGGKSWQLLDQGLDSDVHTIVIDPRDTNRLYIATGGHDCRAGRASGRALYMSQDAGATWSPIAADFSQEYSVPLVMHPKNPDVLYTALANGQPGQWRKRSSGAESFIIRSQDGGKSWSKLDGDHPEIKRSFPEALVIRDDQPDHLYAALRSGDIYRSEDGGNSWTGLGVKIPSITDLHCVAA